MPEYRITITDKNWKEVKNRVNKNMLRVIDETKKARNSKFMKPFYFLFKKKVGMDFDISIKNKWISDKVLIHKVFIPVPLKNKYWDSKIKNLRDWGKMKIERINEDGSKEVIVDG